MIKIACIFAFLAVAFAQIQPQTGFLSINTLNSGSTVVGTLSYPLTGNTYYHVDIYQLWVPENTSHIDVMFENTDSSSCTWIDLFASSYSIPCSDQEYDSSYQCANAWDIGGGIQDYENSWTPYTSSELFRFVVNNYIYIGVSRYNEYEDETCTYTLQLSANTSDCAQGEVVVSTDSSSVACVAYDNVNASTVYSIVANVQTLYVVAKYNVGQNVGNVHIVINSSTTDLYLYGRAYGGASSSSYDCSESSYTTMPNGMYMYDLWCFNPRQGDWFFTIYCDDSSWNATMQLNVQTCAANMGGYNCSSPLTALNMSSVGTPMSVVVPYTGGNSLEYGAVYYYVDIPANTTGGDLVLTANSAGSGYLMSNKNGFPSYDVSGYQYSTQYDSYPAVLSFNQFDWQLGGRFYFGLSCYTEGGCTVTMSGNSTAPATSGTQTGSQSTGTQTGTQSTGSGETTVIIAATTAEAAQTTSGAVSVVVSVFAVVAIALAML